MDQFARSSLGRLADDHIADRTTYENADDSPHYRSQYRLKRLAMRRLREPASEPRRKQYRKNHAHKSGKNRHRIASFWTAGEYRRFGLFAICPNSVLHRPGKNKPLHRNGLGAVSGFLPFVRGLKDTIFPGCSPGRLPLTIGKGPVDVRERVSRFAFARRRHAAAVLLKGPARPRAAPPGFQFRPRARRADGRVFLAGSPRGSAAPPLVAAASFPATKKPSCNSPPRSRGRTAWLSSRLTRRAAPLSRRPGCTPPPLLKLAGARP